MENAILYHVVDHVYVVSLVLLIVQMKFLQ